MGRKVAPAVTRSAGVVALTRTGETQTEIARRLGVSRTLVAMVMSGQRAASADLRASAHRVYRIALEAWDLPAGAEPRPRQTKHVAPTTPPSPPKPSSSEPLALRVAELQRHVDELMGEVQSGSATPLERARVLASVAATTIAIGKLTGEGMTISERKIVSLPSWRRIESTLIEALTPYPDALHAAGKALMDLGETG